MKEQEEQAGVQFTGSKASPPASPFLTGDLNSGGAGEPQLLRGLEPRHCTEPYAPKELSARLDGLLCPGTLSRRCREGGGASGAAGMALGSWEPRVLCFCLLVQRSAVSSLQARGHGQSRLPAFPSCPCSFAMPQGLLESVQRVSSRLSLPLHAHLSQALMCLDVETSIS